MKKKTIVKNLVFIILLLASLIGIIIALVNIIVWKLDANNTEKQVEDIINIINIEEVSDNENVEIVEQKKEIPKANPYWDYIKMNLINVDFNELKKKNTDTKGWIQVSGTNINYPFVQTDNNDYYLNHSYDKSKNNAGWVFLDYRNRLDNEDKNTILYGHGRVDKTMFGSLKNILTNGWLKNKNNFTIKLSTEYENTLWQVFSVYKIPTTNDYIETSFNNNSEFLKLVNILKERSLYNFDTELDENDRILTLSTCYDKDDKVVLHAKLIKIEKRK